MISEKLKKDQKRQEDILKTSSSLEQVKLLSDSDSSLEQNLLNTAFFNTKNVLFSEKDQEMKKLKKISEEYGSEVYTIEQIKNFCLQYRLRFLPSTLYSGVVPSSALFKAREIIKNNKRLSILNSTDSETMRRNSFILAPAKMFNLNSVKNKEIYEEKKRIEEDPAWFFKIEDDKYLFISEWGNSFSKLRKFYAWFLRTQKRVDILYITSVIFTFFTVLFIFFPFLKFLIEQKYIFSSIIVALIIIADFVFLIGADTRIASENYWNKDTKL